MAVAQRMTAQEYEAFVLSGVEGQWELRGGVLVEKPGMTWKHGGIIARFSYLLQSQLDWNQYQVRINEGRVRTSSDTISIPDLLVVPTAFGEDIRDLLTLAIFTAPLPLVVEVWSPSTGSYDLAAKLPVYQERGDLEIVFAHPYERTLTSWVRQADGSYRETRFHGGRVALSALPGVTIDLDQLFDV
jgi:Uma2 family endonuclease